MELIGQNLRKVRKSFGLTQLELGQRTGVSRETINRIERNKLSPTVALMYRICTKLGVDVNRIMSEPTEKKLG